MPYAFNEDRTIFELNSATTETDGLLSKEDKIKLDTLAETTSNTATHETNGLMSSTDKTTLDNMANNAAADILTIYPVGAIYISYVNTSPAQLFGGTWVSLTGVFPYFNNGTSKGGSNTHTLTVSQMPAHSHEVNLNYYYYGTKGSNPPVYTDASGSVTSSVTSKITTTSKGGGSAHNNMPAYQTLYAWRRTA